jgi:hypothetical protein
VERKCALAEIVPSMDDDASDKHGSQVRKQKEALEKAKSLAQRPPVQTPSETQITKNNSKAASFVTYPEFAPPPASSPGRIFTLRHLLLLVYLSCGTTAVVYLLSKVVYSENSR